MRLVSHLARGTIVLAVIAGYAATIYMGSTEEHRRSLKIEQQVETADSVVLDVTITSIDTRNGLVTERIHLVPMGAFATDKSTPSKDLKLLINSISGQQTVVFPKGERIGPFNATTVLSGNPNRYPFDAYSTDIDFLVTTPAVRSAASIILDDTSPSIAFPGSSSLIVGTSDLTHSQTVPVFQNIVASLPQFKLRGTVKQNSDNLAETHISIRRANYVVGASVVVMLMMILLAISIMSMVLRVTASPGEINLLPLTLCVTLIFGLPALRNMQPDVPGVGVLGDYVSFMWSQFIVTASAVALAWTWIIRSQQHDNAKRAMQTDIPPKKL